MTNEEWCAGLRKLENEIGWGRALGTVWVAAYAALWVWSVKMTIAAAIVGDWWAAWYAIFSTAFAVNVALFWELNICRAELQERVQRSLREGEKHRGAK